MTEHDIPYLNTLREQLVSGIAAQQPRRQRRRFVVRFALASAAVATAAVAAVVFIGGSATQSADAAILRHVRAALAPSAEVILHEQAVATLNGSRVHYESWQLETAPYSFRRIKGPTETSYDGTTLATYDASTNTITEEAATTPRPLDDPVASLRQLLQTGDAKIVTTTTLNGRRVYEITAHSSEATLNGTLYVDTATYAPVRAELPGPGCPGDDCAGPETIDFVAYAQLPVNETNRKLLSVVATHPQARVVAAPPTTTSATSTTPASTTPAPKSSTKPAPSPSGSTTTSG
jgi:outer membrane lipoprotein-sorting protein